jgi:hypothetical protein
MGLNLLECGFARNAAGYVGTTVIAWMARHATWRGD